MLKRLKKLITEEFLTIAETFEIVRQCPSAEWLGASVVPCDTNPTDMASSENLRILEFIFPSDHRILEHLHLPNLQVLVVHCIFEGGFEIMHAISRFIRDSGRSLQVLRVVSLGIKQADLLFYERGVRKIPILEIHVGIPLDKYDEFEEIISEHLDRWKKMDSRFKKSLRPDNRAWTVGWVESKVLRWDVNSLPADILDIIDVGLLV